MWLYFMRRLLFMIPVLLLLSVVVFLVAHLAPGSPVDLIAGPTATQEIRQEIAAKYGLDQPLPAQYFRWLANVARADMGRSIVTGRPVLSLILQRLPATLELGLAAWLLAYGLGIPIGIVAAVKQYSLLDNTSIFLAVLGVSIPDFWLSLMLMLIFAAGLRWFPVGGYGGLSHVVLPAFALGMGRMAVVARIVRASMLEVMSEDYVRTARAKGLVERVVLLSHGFRNALLPLVSLAGLYLGYLVGGAVVVETVFARPGVGYLIVKSVAQRDFPVVQGAVLVLGMSVLTFNLITDIAYAIIDPRIRYG